MNSIPVLIRAESTVLRCARCGTWSDRYPTFAGMPQDDSGCGKCGCTSVKLSRGRPFSKRSRVWREVLKEWKAIYPFLRDDLSEKELAKIVTVLPCKRKPAPAARVEEPADSRAGPDGPIADSVDGYRLRPGEELEEEEEENVRPM